ncbi:hypothetical protein PS15p_211931 [Mucor circinelloides]
MVDSRYQHSFVEKALVPSCSNASSPFCERDLSDQHKVLSQLKSVHGNTKDMLDYIANRGNICIVSFDFAGLSTSVWNL